MKLHIALSVVIIFFFASCVSDTPAGKQVHCGYQLTGQEYIDLRAKADLQESAYDADTIGHIYDQLNDSIRAVMPDTVTFEVFLSLLNRNEVGIDIYVPKNKEFFERIGCAIMNAHYKKMPEQRYMCLYSYTNPDGSGDIPFEVAIRRLK